MRFRVWISILCLSLACGAAHAAETRYFADYHHVPPPAAKSGQPWTFPEPWSREAVAEILEAPRSKITLSTFSARAVPVKDIQDVATPWQVAFGETIGLDASQLFREPLETKRGSAFLAEFSSLDAAALRLRVDLSGLRPGERLWLLPLQGDQVFGPFTHDQAVDGGSWLPTIFGDSIVLLLEGEGESPRFTLLGYSHFQAERFFKQQSILPCNIPAGCESDSVALRISAGVGLMILPVGDNMLACSGALLNAPAVADNGAYFLSAEHCFDPSVSLDGLEVLWDFRGAGCSGQAVPPPPEARTLGAETIASNAVLDIRLIRLKQRPYTGPYGRTWIGWDTRAPEVGEGIQNFHFPLASSMKTSRGQIRGARETICMDATCSRYYEQQTRVIWTEGVTEPGSSGSPLLTRDGAFRVMGVLSNGPLHSCSATDGNTDNFGSFAYFFPQIGCRLIPDYACGAAYQPQSSSCCIARLMASGKTLENLRVFRDRVLMPTDWGKALANQYYQTGHVAHAWVERSPLMRLVAEALITVFAAWGAAL